MKVCVTGAAGFISGYLVEELLDNGYKVVGIDNFSKYGEIEQGFSQHPDYKFIRGDVKDTALLKDILSDCEIVVAGAAKVGGIAYFHEFAYDLLAENERIISSTYDAALWAFKNKGLKKIVVLSSSMVFENTDVFPTPEYELRRCPPPSSTYGFQKLACEYYAKGAWEQYKLPYVIVRPFNCVGIGERKAKTDKVVKSGNIRLGMGHVVPELILKVLKGQEPLHIYGDGTQTRCYTYGGDIARGIRLCMEKEEAICEDFNISNPVPMTVLEVAKLVREKILGTRDDFRFISDPPYKYDVKKRIPSVEKAKRLLGFEATTPLDVVLDELIPWIKKQIELGNV